MTKSKYIPPIYIQIKDLIYQKIQSGEYEYGSKLPSERELSELYSISRMTARSALSELVNEGIANRTRGKGTFVSYPMIERDLVKLSGFSQMLKEKKIVPRNKLIKINMIEADKFIASMLNTTIGSKIYEIIRVRYGNEAALALEYSYLQENLFPNLLLYDFERESLYNILEENYNCKLKYAKQWISLYKTNAFESELLDIKEDTTVFLFQSITYDENDNPLEVTKSLNRGDRCTFYTELWRNNE